MELGNTVDIDSVRQTEKEALEEEMEKVFKENEDEASIMVNAVNVGSAFLRGKQIVIEDDDDDEERDELEISVPSEELEEIIERDHSEDMIPWTNHRLHGKQTRKIEHTEDELSSWMDVISNFEVIKKNNYKLVGGI
eukprot:TRINITY_DN3613_c0_g1_i2.p1 TRINITY_DN3613_c0_g1~~TRINITY_DN3613_c0_g1_i2.p1  ORF type:complete len:137 (-),score=48.14 TRINITY_DN3613_c0_g1_i2:130-540(-)